MKILHEARALRKSSTKESSQGRSSCLCLFRQVAWFCIVEIALVLDTNPDCLAGVEDYGAIGVPADILVFAGEDDHKSNEEGYHAAEKPYAFSIIVMRRGEKEPTLIYKKVVNMLNAMLALDEYRAIKVGIGTSESSGLYRR